MKTSKPRWLTEERPFDRIRPGDRLLLSFGVATVAEVVPLEFDRARFVLVGQPAVTIHRSNWPTVVLGRAAEA